MTLSDLDNEFLIEFRRMKGLWGLPGLSVTPLWLCDQFVITAEHHKDNLVSLDNNEAQQQQSCKAYNLKKTSSCWKEESQVLKLHNNFL